MVVLILLLLQAALLLVSPEVTALQFGKAGWWWKLIAHQLDHGNFKHFLGNWLFFFPAYAYLESRIGGLRFILAYLFMGVVAALGQGAFMWWSGAMIGSSGAGCGAVTAAAFLLPKKIRLGALILLALLLLGQIEMLPFAAIYRVGVMAHLSGAFAGLMVVNLLPHQVR